MSRTYVNCSWSNADTNDYSGRQQPHMIGDKANTKAYAEPEPVKKTKKVKTPDFRTLDQKREDTLDKKRVQFEKAFEEGTISFDQYEALLTEWEKSMTLLEKRMGLVKDEAVIDPTPVAKRSIINALENAANSFRANHPFMFTVSSILFGCGLLNLVGFGG